MNDCFKNALLVQSFKFLLRGLMNPVSDVENVRAHIYASCAFYFLSVYNTTSKEEFLKT